MKDLEPKHTLIQQTRQHAYEMAVPPQSLSEANDVPLLGDFWCTSHIHNFLSMNDSHSEHLIVQICFTQFTEKNKIHNK